MDNLQADIGDDKGHLNQIEEVVSVFRDLNHHGSIPIDFDKRCNIDVFVLFTIGWVYLEQKKASSRAQKTLGGFLLEPSENPIWQRAPNGWGEIGMVGSWKRYVSVLKRAFASHLEKSMRMIRAGGISCGILFSIVVA
jgi:hypothetical protein